MAANRESSFVVSFDGDAGTFRSVLSALKSQIKSDVADLEATTAKVELFKNADTKLKTLGDAALKARDNVVTLQQGIDRINAAGGKVGDDLTKALSAAEKAAASASREYNRQADTVDRLRGRLQAAGVDTKNLTGEELRLAAALKEAQAQANLAASKDVLGFKGIADVAPKIAELRVAFANLSASGKLSATEIAAAQKLLQQRLAEVNGSLSTVTTTARTGGPELVRFFQSSILPALGITASAAGAAAAIKDVIGSANEFKQGIAEIGTVTNLTKDQLDALGAGARELATSLGLDLQATLKGLFDLIRSGVPPENALSVLRVSAEAAKASLTDVGTGVKAANLLIDAFGANLADLPALFDKIIVGAHNGGATLKEFADSAGPLLNVARAAGISFDDLLATLTVLVDKSGNAEKSIGDLTKIIAKLDTTDARAKLRDLGITGDTLVDIFQQIGAKGLTLQDVLGLGLSASGVKSAASIAALTKNAQALPEALDKIRNSAGETAKSLNIVSEAPADRIAKLTSQIHDLGVQLGLLATHGAPLVSVLTSVVGGVNGLVAAGSRVPGLFTIIANYATLSSAALRAMGDSGGPAKTALEGVGTAAAGAGAQIENIADRTDRARSSLKDFGADLLTQVTALNAGLARDLADINARAEAEISALDRSRAAQAATAQQTLQIQLQAAADRLAVITKSEKDITDAVDKANQAREKIERAQGQNETKIAADSATARIAALGPVLAQYQAHYAALINLAQSYAAKAQSAEQARVDIAKSVAEEVRQIRLGELDSLDQFVAKQQHIDELISEGRRKAAEGDVEAAKQYFDQAIAESKGLTEVIDQNGVVVITSLQARTTRLEELKKIADAANESIGGQGDAAKRGADAAIAAANSVADKIKELQGTYDALKATAAEGLDLKVNVDEQSVARAVSTLDDLTRDRTVTVTVNVQQGTNTAGVSAGGATGTFNRGGYVPRFVPPTETPIQAFATGGPVFRGPKVPGVGNRDTFPALLMPGSFVVRKAASEHYGDTLMGKVARMATGGYVADWFAQAKTQYQAFYDANVQPQAQSGYFGDVKAGTQESDRVGGDAISPPTLPSDPKELLKAVMKYVGDVRSAALTDDYFYWAKLLRLLDTYIANYERAPTGDNLEIVLRQARTIGLNLGRSHGDFIGFDVDGRKWHKTPGTDAFSPPGLAGLGNTYDFYGKGGGVGREALFRLSSAIPQPAIAPRPAFAVGGPSTDTVPALLTPGEFVVPKPTVDRLGVGFFDALNSVRLPKLNVEALLAPPPKPMHFATGGYVGDAAPRGAGSPAATSRATTININASAGDLLSRENVRRFIVPVLTDIERKTR